MATEQSTWVECAEVAHLHTTSGHTITIDAADLHLVGEWRWQVSAANPDAPHLLYASRTYAVRDEHGKRHPAMLYMHRCILGAGRGQVVDHINGNGLDNRRVNLRLCTMSENQGNRPMNRNNPSGYKGVKATRHGTHMACITRAGKRIYLGSYADVEDAARAYDAAARAQFGAFACVNFPAPGERSARTGAVHASTTGDDHATAGTA